MLVAPSLLSGVYDVRKTHVLQALSGYSSIERNPDVTILSNNIAALLEHINLLLIHETPARMYMHYLCLELAEIIPTALVPPRDFEVFIPVCRPGCFEPPLFCNQDMIVKNTRSTSTAISQHVAPLYGPSKSAYI